MGFPSGSGGWAACWWGGRKTPAPCSQLQLLEEARAQHTVFSSQISDWPLRLPWGGEEAEGGQGLHPLSFLSVQENVAMKGTPEAQSRGSVQPTGASSVLRSVPNRAVQGAGALGRHGSPRCLVSGWPASCSGHQRACCRARGSPALPDFFPPGALVQPRVFSPGEEVENEKLGSQGFVMHI